MEEHILENIVELNHVTYSMMMAHQGKKGKYLVHNYEQVQNNK